MNHIEKINTIKNYKRLRDQQYDKTLEHLGGVFKKENFFIPETPDERRKLLPLRRIIDNVRPHFQQADAAYEEAAWESLYGRLAKRQIRRDVIVGGIVDRIPIAAPVFYAIEMVTESDMWRGVGDIVEDITRKPHRYITNNAVRFVDFTSYLIRRTIS